MADSKLQELDAITSPQDSDLLYVVRNEDGTYTDNKITKANLVGTVPTKTSDITNDSGFITAEDVTVPTDISELADSTGVIPADVSDLTDSTGVIPTTAEDVSALPISGGTMSGDIDMGDNSVTTVSEVNFGNNTLVSVRSGATGDLWLQGNTGVSAINLYANDTEGTAVIDVSQMAGDDKIFTLPNETGTIALKEYVDQAITELGMRYYSLKATGTFAGNTYYTTSATASELAEDSILTEDVASDGVVATWMSPDGGTPTKLLAGHYDFHVYAKVNGQPQTALYWELVEITSEGVETVIGTSGNSNLLTATKSELEMLMVLTSDYTPTAGSKILGKVKAKLLSSGLAPDITLYVQGTSQAHWELPVNTEILDTIYAKTTDIPSDVSELTDTTGVIPDDISANVLLLDNTTEFTPDADYEPATKKYVDDNAGGEVVERKTVRFDFGEKASDSSYTEWVSDAVTFTQVGNGFLTTIPISGGTGYIALQNVVPDLFDRNPVLKMDIDPDNVYSNGIFVGVGDYQNGGNYFGLRWQNQAQFLRTSAGGTATETNTSTALADGRHEIMLKLNSGSNVEFYYDGVLKLTKTTNIPSGDLWFSDLFIMKTSGSSAVEETFSIKNIEITYDALDPA